jgi:hypothetical protein
LRRQQLLPLMVLLIGGSIILLALGFSHVLNVNPLGLSTHALQFGSRETGTVGWLLPADTPISTSYTSNHSLTGFIGATLNVFPYEVVPGTILQLGLYVDGQLAATQSYTLSGTYHTPATIVQTIATGVANFSNSMLGFTVSELSLKTTLPPGTNVTVTAWASSPIWAQVDPTPLTQSYEMQASTTYSPVATIIEDSGSVAPYTLSVGLESNAA